MPASDVGPDSGAQSISPEELNHYKEHYNLSGQLDLLLGIHQEFSLTGKTVLEIGGSNIPRPFIFDVLKATRWVSIDHVYSHNRNFWPRQYEEVQVLPIATGLEFENLSSHVVLDGGVEFLPQSLSERFDAVVSIDAFEHILKFATMLDRAFTALKPGGKLVATYSPIWPCHIGHHVWGITDKSGRTFYPESSPIPAWGHLLMRPDEMYEHLLGHTDRETADEVVCQVYHSENLNRLFVEDYEAYFRQSQFPSYRIRSFVPDVTPAPEIQTELERLYPGRKQFSRIGNSVGAEKP